MSRDDSQPPFPSGFGAEFDQAAWDHARSVAADHVRAFNRRSDKRLAKMTAPAVPVMGYAVYLMVDAGDYWWATALALITAVMAVALLGMYRGWDHR